MSDSQRKERMLFHHLPPIKVHSMPNCNFCLPFDAPGGRTAKTMRRNLQEVPIKVSKLVS